MCQSREIIWAIEVNIEYLSGCKTEIIIHKPNELYIKSFNIQRTHITANNSTSNNVVFFFVSDLKILYSNN